MLLLRDALGWSAAETAGLLGIREGNARVIHLRARRALEGYDRARCVLTPELRAAPPRGARALPRRARRAGRRTRVESMLAESVATETDAGGAYTALTERLAGRARVARFYLSRRADAPRRRAPDRDARW